MLHQRTGGMPWPLPPSACCCRHALVPPLAALRREALLLNLNAAAAVLLFAPPANSTAAVDAASDYSTAATASAGAGDAASFYSEWPYAKPSDVLPFVRATAPQGDVQAVLDALDSFAEHYPMYRVGPEKGALLEAELEEWSSQNKSGISRALELGTFLGYSALRTQRHLAPGGMLVCVEANPANAAVARALFEYAGVSPGRIIVLEGVAAEVIPKLPSVLLQHSLQEGSQPPTQAQQQQQQQQFDFVFLDHGAKGSMAG